MPKYLERALNSIFNQTYQNFVVLLIGDKCPILDEWVKTYWASKDSRFKYYNLSTNYGPGGAVPRNYALKSCKTKWVAYLDDDNEWLSNHLSSLMAITMKTDAEFASSSMLINGKELKCEKPEFGQIDTSEVLHKKSLVEKFGWWADRVTVGYSHDWEFINRWVKAGIKWAVTGKATVIYNAETSGQKEFLDKKLG